MATAWDEYQRQLFEAVLHGGRSAPLPAQPHPDTMPILGPAAPPRFARVNPFSYMARQSPQQTAPAPVQPRPQQQQAQPQQMAPPQYPDEMIQRLQTAFPEMSEAYLRQLQPQEINGLVALADKQGWKPLRPAGLTPQEQQIQTQPDKDGGGLLNAVSGAVGTATDLIPDAVSDPVGTAVDVASNIIGSPSVTNIGTGFGIQGEADPQPMTSWERERTPEVAASTMDDARYNVEVLNPLRDRASEQDIVNAIGLTDIEIELLELKSNPTNEEMERLELLKIEREQLDVLNYVLYGVEPPQPDAPWYQEAVDWGLTALSKYDLPRQALRPISGTIVYIASKDTPLGRMLRANPAVGETVNVVGPATIEQLWQEGGGESVWEDAVAKVPELGEFSDIESLLYHMISDTSFDPLTYVGAAAGITKGVPIVGRTLAGVNAAANLPGDVALGTLRTAGKVLGKTPVIKQGIDWAARPTAETIVRRDVLEPTVEGLRTIKAGGYVDETGAITAPGVTPRVTEIGTTYRTPVRNAGVPPKGPNDPGYVGTAYRTPVDPPPPVEQLGEDAAVVADQIRTLTRPNHPNGTSFTPDEFQTYRRFITQATGQGTPFEQAVDDAYEAVVTGRIGTAVDDTLPTPSRTEPLGDLTTREAPAAPRTVDDAVPAATVTDDALDEDVSLLLTNDPNYQHLNPGKQGAPRLVERIAALPGNVRSRIWPQVQKLTDELIADPRYRGTPKGERVKPDWRNAGGEAWPEAVRVYQYVVDLARLYKSVGGDVRPEDVFTTSRRISSAAKGAPTVSDNTDWLIQRYITTTDQAEARAILTILRGEGINVKNSSTGRSVRKGGFANKDFKTKELVSPYYTDQVLSDLQQVRSAWQDVMKQGPSAAGPRTGFSAIDSNPTARRGLDIVNKYLDRHSGQQADELTAVADDADDWIEPFTYRKDKLAAFAKTGTLPQETVAMLDEAVPLAQAVQTPESVVRTGKRSFSAQQKKIIKALVKKFGEDAEVRRWDIFEEALLQNAGDVKNTMRDFEAILGVRSTDLKGLLKPLADFYSGAKTMIRHAWMYNTPRLGYNLTQDTATDTFAHMADGQIDAATLAYRGYRNAIQDQLENSRYRPTQKIGQYLNEQFPSTVTEDVQGLHQILELDVGEEVASMTGARFDDAMKEWVEEGKTWWTRKAGLAGSVVAPDFSRNLRTMFDDVKRLSTKTEFIQRNIVQSRDEFYDYLRQYAAKTGDDADAWISRIEASGADYHGHTLFGPSDIREAVGGGRGEHLARRWRSNLTALDKDARSHMRKYLFSYRQTNADSLIGQVFLFHYWMTRASVLHTRLVLDHPWLAAAYFRAWEGMEKQDTSHLPAWAQQFISLNVGPYGMLGLASPTALMVGLGTVLDLNGLTEIDSVQDVLSVLPVNPVVMAAGSVLWNDQTPDLTGTNQTRQFYRAAANYLNQTFDLGYDGVIPDYVGEGTYWLQDTIRNVLPGGEPLAGPSPSERDTQGVQFYASQIMQEQGTLLDEQGAPTDEANQVMANIDAGLYSGEIEQEALDRFVTDTMAGRLAMTQFPVQTVTPGFAANQRTLNRQGDDAFFGETTLDTSSLTGFGSTARDRTPEEQAADFTLRMTDAGGPEATTLLGQLAQYDLLGDDEQRATWDSYYQVLYGAGETLQAQLGGEAMDFGFGVISYDEWDALDHDTRAGLLDQWIAASGYKNEWNSYRDLRDEYEATHPETAGFKEWQDQIRESIKERGVDGTLNELLDISPSFAAWWQQQNTDPAYVQIALMRPEAYLAAEGVKPGHWDSNAIDSGPTTDMSQINPMDVIVPQDSGGGFGSGKSFDHMTTIQRIDALNEDIVKYQQDMTEWDAQVKLITGGRSIESMNPLAQQALLPQLPSQPRGSEVLRSYIDWMNMQPASADVSVAAYVEWFTMMEQEEAVAA